MIEQEWRLEIWSRGEFVPEPVLIATLGSDNYLEEDQAEPVASLDDLKAIMDYIRLQFPGGWKVEDGKVVSYHSEGKGVNDGKKR